MKKINVELVYTSEDPPGFEKPFHFVIRKTFNLPEVPPIPCEIKLEDDAIKSFYFSDPAVYDPKDNSYTVRNLTTENVGRYYHGDAEELMAPVLDRYKKHGWKWEKVMETIYTD